MPLVLNKLFFLNACLKKRKLRKKQNPKDDIRKCSKKKYAPLLISRVFD